MMNVHFYKRHENNWFVLGNLEEISILNLWLNYHHIRDLGGKVSSLW